MIVKDTGKKLSIYKTMPKSVVSVELYTKLNTNQSKAVMSCLTGTYLEDTLKKHGKAFMGQRNTMKKHVRQAIKDNK